MTKGKSGRAHVQVIEAIKEHEELGYGISMLLKQK